jgi:hypothetical protein
MYFMLDLEFKKLPVFYEFNNWNKKFIFFRVARSLSFFFGGGGLMFLANFDLKIYDFNLLKGFFVGKMTQIWSILK